MCWYKFHTELSLDIAVVHSLMRNGFGMQIQQNHADMYCLMSFLMLHSLAHTALMLIFTFLNKILFKFIYYFNDLIYGAIVHWRFPFFFLCVSYELIGKCRSFSQIYSVIHMSLPSKIMLTWQKVHGIYLWILKCEH